MHGEGSALVRFWVREGSRREAPPAPSCGHRAALGGTEEALLSCLLHRPGGPHLSSCHPRSPAKPPCWSGGAQPSPRSRPAGILTQRACPRRRPRSPATYLCEHPVRCVLLLWLPKRPWPRFPPNVSIPSTGHKEHFFGPLQTCHEPEPGIHRVYFVTGTKTKMSVC